MKFFKTRLHNFSSLIKSNSQDDIKLKLTKLKSYMELFTSPGIESEMDLNDIKIFLTLFTECRSLVENSFFLKESFKNQINSIIKLNKSIEKNNDLTKHIFYKLQFEKNEYIFRSLLANIFTLTKKTDEDNLAIQYIPYFGINLKSVNPSIIMKSNLLLSTIQNLTKELNINENYKGLGSEYLANYFNIFPKIGVDVTDTDAFKFHSKLILFEKLQGNSKGLNLNETLEYFDFFLNFKNILTYVTFKDKLDITGKFKERFKDLFFNDKLNKNDSYPNMENLPVNLRYDDIYKILNFFKDDHQMVTICEVILHKKLAHHICPVNTLIDILNIYLNCLNNAMTKNILLFTAFNSIEHLNNRVTKYSFEKDFVLIYGVICNFCLLAPQSETLSEFFEEFKSTLFHNKFINIFEKDMGTLSNRSLLEIRNLHNTLLHTNYFDKAFSKYLENTINLSNQIVSILL